jgi:hypothetical protein
MTRYLPLLLLAPLLLMAADDKGKPASKEDGFVPLFDGKTLKGWVPVNAAPDTFFVKDGLLVTTGVPTGFLRTDKRYENFILECEYMHVKPKGNSGIFVWADPLPAVGTPFTRAIEVQVLDGLETKNYTSHGDVFAIWGAKFVPDREHPGGWMRCLPSEKRAKPAGEWNHYRIECNDGSIKLAVNGKVVSGGTKSNPRFGYIALEAEGSECRYRNLRIKELPSTKPKLEESCPEATGHTTLFTGVDLKGWSTREPAAWKVNAGANTLAHAGKGLSQLTTENAFGDYELQLDVKPTKGSTAAIGNRESPTTAYPLRLSAADAGKWVRLSIVARGQTMEIYRDGKLGGGGRATGKVPARGPVVLIAEGPVEFTNLFLRPLKAEERPKDGVE